MSEILKEGILIAIRFYDGVLTDQYVSALGDPTVTPIPISPSPSSTLRALFVIDSYNSKIGSYHVGSYNLSSCSNYDTTFVFYSHHFFLHF